MSEPEQLDPFNWLSAQPPGPASAAPSRAAVHTTVSLGLVLLTCVSLCYNMHRFYSAALATSLFGELGVVRQWGRIGSQGQSRTEWYEGSGLAETARQTLLIQKRRRGYIAALTAYGQGS